MHYRYFGKSSHATAVMKVDYARVRDIRPQFFKKTVVKDEAGKDIEVDGLASPMAPKERHVFCKKRI